MDDERYIRHAERLADVVVGDDNADPVAAQLAEDALEFDDLLGIDAGKRLVKQQEAGCQHQRASDFDPTPLASGQLVSVVVSHPVQPETADQVVESLATFRRQQGQRLQDRHDVLVHRQLAEYGRLLRQVADAQACPLVHRHIGDVRFVNEDAPRIRADQADDHVERSGLARAVGAEQADHTSPLHGEGEIADDLPTSVALGESGCTQSVHQAGVTGSGSRSYREGGRYV